MKTSNSVHTQLMLAPADIEAEMKITSQCAKGVETSKILLFQSATIHLHSTNSKNFK